MENNFSFCLKFLLILLFSLNNFASATVTVGYTRGNDALRWYGNESDLSVFSIVEYHTEEGDPIAASAVFFDNAHFNPPNRRYTDEERLTGMLFRNYASSLRPVYNSSKPVNVLFGVNLIQIGNMDEVNQVLEVSVWLEMTWLEERLRWDPKEFSGLKMIRIPTRLLWTPDIVLYNNADDFDRRTKAEEVRAMIANSGEIFLGPYIKLRSTCILDLTLYPYDEQQCKLVFGSWTYDSSQLILKSKGKTVQLSQYIDSAKWEFLESSVVHAERHHTCCKAPYSDIVITIKMRRRFLYNNLFNIFIPTIWLSLLCLLCFYLAPESGEKITLGITVLLTFTWYTWMIAENTPRTSDFIPLISIYLTVTMTLSALVVGLQVFMLNVHGLAPVLRPVPHWLRSVVIDGIARTLHIENVHKDAKRKKTKRQTTSSRLQQGGFLRTANKNAAKLRGFAQRLGRLLRQGEEYRMPEPTTSLFSMQNFAGESFSDPLIDDHLDNMMNELNSLSRLRFMAREGKFFESVERVVIGNNEEPYPGVERPIESDVLLRLVESVAYMSRAAKTDALTAQVANEWRLIAVVFDRLAFWFFFVFTMLLTFCLLVLIPLTQKVYPKPQSLTSSAPPVSTDTDHNEHTFLFMDDY